MPFKSKAQRGKFAHLLLEGKISTETFEEWNRKLERKKIPEHVLRRLKDSEVIRPVSATRNTVKALEERGLIAPAKGNDPLRIIWQLQKTKRQRKSQR